MGYFPDLEVKALLRGVVVVLIRVGVTKAIFARCEETTESFWVAKPRKIYTNPCTVIL